MPNISSRFRRSNSCDALYFGILLQSRQFRPLRSMREDVLARLGGERILPEVVVIESFFSSKSAGGFKHEESIHQVGEIVTITINVVSVDCRGDEEEVD